MLSLDAMEPARDGFWCRNPRNTPQAHKPDRHARGLLVLLVLQIGFQREPPFARLSTRKVRKSHFIVLQYYIAWWHHTFIIAHAHCGQEVVASIQVTVNAASIELEDSQRRVGCHDESCIGRQRI